MTMLTEFFLARGRRRPHLPGGEHDRVVAFTSRSPTSSPTPTSRAPPSLGGNSSAPDMTRVAGLNEEMWSSWEPAHPRR